MNDSERLHICRLLLKKIDGTLSPEESVSLHRELDDNGQVLDMYVDLALLYSDLSKTGNAYLSVVAPEISASEQYDKLLRELSQAERDAETVVIEKIPESKDQLIRKVQRDRTVYKINKASVASLVVSAAAILTLVLFLRFAPVRTDTPIATLSRTVGAEWRNLSEYKLWEGCDLYAGPLTLVKGYAEIRTDAGTEIILQAPVELDLESVSQLALDAGRITVKITQAENQYVVRTPTASVVDFGTEFGVFVDNDKQTLTYVYDGQVELRSGSNPLRVDRVLKLTKGQGAEADTQGQLHYRDRISSVFVRSDEFEVKLAASKGSSYERWLAYSYELRRDPDLILYLPFLKSDASRDFVTNYAVNAKGGLKSSLGGSFGISNFTSPTWSVGRWQEKAALRFERDKRTCLSISEARDLNIGGDITLAAWVSCPDIQKGGHLFSNRVEKGVNYQFGCFSREDPYYAGKLQFLRTDDPFSSHVYSRQVVNWTEEWTLLAVTHDGEQVCFYVNGELYESVPYVFEKASVPALLFIGDVPAAGGKTFGYAAFNGFIDEIAIFKRALSVNEMQQMYQAGKP